MKVKNIDLTLLDGTIKILESTYQHRKAHPLDKSEEVFYELMVKYFRRLKTVREEGKYLVGHTVAIPTEIFYAMDIVPMHLESTSGSLAPLLDMAEESFSTARAFGLTPEICSAHRNLAAHIIRGWLPRPDAFIWSNQVCDNTAKSGDLLVELYGSPGFFLDRPYRYTPREVQYFTKELEKLVLFLEELTEQKMDWDRLKETVEQSQQVTELAREIAELRKAVPAPMRNRRFGNLLTIEFLYSGTPEAVTFYQCVRDEVKERVEKKIGFIPKERYRILNLFMPPTWRLMDWMEREHKAVSVMEPYCSIWGGEDMDLSNPLESIARKCFYRPICMPMHGPIEEGILHHSVQAAIDYQSDGAIYWAHIGCRQSDACIRIIKDALMEQAGKPTLVLDNDILDRTFAPSDQLKDRLEGFFEILEGYQ